VWTSAHATFLADLDQFELAPSPPSLFSVPNEFSEPELGGLYDRRNVQKPECRHSAPLLALLGRCTAAGSRGWDGVLLSSLEKSEGCRRLLGNALAVSLSGMSSSISPENRMCWQDRQRLFALFSSRLDSAALNSFAKKCITEFKEATRRMLSTTTENAFAARAALSKLGQPSASLKPSPLGLCCAGLRASSNALVAAGRSFLDGSDLVTAVKEAFVAQIASAELPFAQSYLGKGSVAMAARVPAVSIAADVFACAFRARFIPFWAHSTSKRLRPTRLDRCQHRALHAQNAATLLTLALGDERLLSLQRMAAEHVSAGQLNLSELCGLLGFPALRMQARSAVEWARAVDAAGEHGPERAAQVLAFCRSASLFEDVRIVELGATTRAKHLRVLSRRVMAEEVEAVPPGADPEQYVHAIPEHARTLFACVECKRVANAHVSDFKTRISFNELGSAGTMISRCCVLRKQRLRCAKRSSASLRAAQGFEEFMSERKVEEDEMDSDAVGSILTTCSAEIGGASRARRDSKVALEQRAVSTPCGKDPLLAIPLIGRAVRLWGGWYSLCCYCGCVTKVTPLNRVGAEIACLNCESSFITGEKVDAAASRKKPVCKFCGKEDPQRGGAPWKLCKAPLDEGGANASLPPPLRTVHFCTAHWRPWIPSSLKVLPTRVVLSHIVFGARPCFSIEEPAPKPKPAARRGRKRGRHR